MQTSDSGLTRGRRHRLRHFAVSLLSLSVVLGLGILGWGTSARAEPPNSSASDTPARYVVTLADQPAATYDGGTDGFPATRPSGTRRLATASSDVRRYRSHLQARQDKVAESVGGRARRHFTVALNGFVTDVTRDQARQLERVAGVVSVVRDRRVSAGDPSDADEPAAAATSSDHGTTPADNHFATDLLGLSGKHGVWARLGGPAQAGRGVVVGVLDSGLWPESASFAGRPLADAGDEAHAANGTFRPYRDGASIVMGKSDGSRFSGVCQVGEEWTARDCNSKVVGARYFGENFLAGLDPEEKLDDYLSPRDGGSHGTHTAATAAGNHGVRATVDGRDFGRISGVAPAAKIAVYKVLWHLEGDPQAHGSSSDVLAGIEAAVTDGVDVINYSIGGGREEGPTDPIATALRTAASAGIFVAAAGGNRGPAPATLDVGSPWVTSVAASTLKPWEGTVRLGDKTSYAGISLSVAGQVGPVRLVNAADVRATGVAAQAAAVCAADSLDPDLVRGTIVVCDRGVVVRLTKSAEVKRAGGVGMILANLAPASLDAELHAVPTIHVDPPASQAIKAYAADSAATATLLPGNKTSSRIPYPQIAAFSSRGPTSTSGGDLLGPDLAAPGVNILAAVAPPSNAGRSFDFLSGTSMAAPHIAGLAAVQLGAGVHPTWSPMAVKSALMTSAVDARTAGGGRQTDPYAQGAGQVHPPAMLDPGLLYDSDAEDWLAFLEGLGVDTSSGVPATDPSNLNTPSIAIGQLAGRQTVTRTVTAVRPGSYRVSASIPGVKIKVSPSTLTFRRAGEQRRFTVTFAGTSAPLDAAATGFLTWRSAGDAVRIPLAVVPGYVAAPEEVTGRSAAARSRTASGPG